MFSFILPCYNDINELMRCLASFTWQKTSTPFEIILVDNNSDSDDLNHAYQAFFSQLPIYLLKQPRLSSTYSLSKARNLGIAIANYPWIVSLDADNILPADYLCNLHKHIEKENSIITGQRIFIDASVLPTEHLSPNLLTQLPRIKSISNYYLRDDRRLNALAKLSTTEHPWAYMHGGNCLFRKSIAIAIGGFDEAYDGHWGYEDIDFAYRLITQTQATPCYDEALSIYHQEREHKHGFEQQRFDKPNNPNWQRICQQIKGFKAHKQREYERINLEGNHGKITHR